MRSRLLFGAFIRSSVGPETFPGVASAESGQVFLDYRISRLGGADDRE
jgi:hypothetical protein